MDPVRFRDCACPETPHAEGDSVTLRPRLSFDANIRALKAILSVDPPMASAAWEIYLFEGVESWNLVDAKGEPVPLTRDAIEALPFDQQYYIANQADGVYSAQVIAPLVEPTKPRSRTSSTTTTSRRRSGSSRTARKQPAQS